MINMYLRRYLDVKREAVPQIPAYQNNRLLSIPIGMP